MTFTFNKFPRVVFLGIIKILFLDALKAPYKFLIVNFKSFTWFGWWLNEIQSKFYVVLTFDNECIRLHIED